jgi:hypothetical protein
MNVTYVQLLKVEIQNGKVKHIARRPRTLCTHSRDSTEPQELDDIEGVKQLVGQDTSLPT